MPSVKKTLTGKERLTKIFYYILRILIVLYVALLFLPGINPARITEKINRNLSLFTSGFFYKSLTSDMGRLISRGRIPEGVIKLVFVSSMFCCIGAVLAGVGGCMSVGNNKLKRFGNCFTLVGGAVGAASIFGIIKARNDLFTHIENNEEVRSAVGPLNPSGITVFLILAFGVLLCSIITFILAPAPKKDEKCSVEPKFQLFLMFMPFALLLFVFSYLPLWGWRYAFFDYSAGGTLSMDKFKGFYWFGYLFKNPATAKHIGRVMVYAVAFCIFSTDGFVSSLFVQQGIWSQGKNLLMSGGHTWLKMWAWGTWKGLGWSAIMYISAISGIDQQLYEAATVDGAGRFQKMWHVTLPALIPTYVVLLTLSIAGILSNGMEQYLCFENPQNTAAIEVLDLYVYKIGINGGLIPLSTVVGMLKSVISVVLLFLTNSISKVIRGQSVV